MIKSMPLWFSVKHRGNTMCGSAASIMSRYVLLGLCWFFSILHPETARAQDQPRQGIIGDDNRTIVRETGSPWEAIGQINVSGFKEAEMCTGTLIAPNLVLTAAHCVTHPSQKRPFPSGNIHFLAGVRGSDNKGHSTAKCVKLLEGYTYMPPSEFQPSRAAGNLHLSAFTKDVVVIVLKDSIGIDPVPLAKGATPWPGLKLVHAAYGIDRRFMLSAHVGCQLLGLEQPFWINDCDTRPGGSGGPVFVTSDEKLKLAAVMVGGIPGRLNAALPISAWGSLTDTAECP
jgi:protease YdgD